tara:strand:- start:132 stop:569 length:438 start_codon:yes stop_codon:yes gene_type:complete
MIIVQLEFDKVNKFTIHENWIQVLCQTILNDNGHDEATITIIFSNDLTLCKLKKEYFGEKVFTDTISFNLEEEGKPIEGEIYISLDRVVENAEIYNNDFFEECKRVIIHSCLHLLGYNDKLPNDKLKMTELEEFYLSQSVTTKQV